MQPNFELPRKKKKRFATSSWILAIQVQFMAQLVTCVLIGRFYSTQKKTLEINPRHPLMKELKARVEVSSWWQQQLICNDTEQEAACRWQESKLLIYPPKQLETDQFSRQTHKMGGLFSAGEKFILAEEFVFEGPLCNFEDGFSVWVSTSNWCLNRPVPAYRAAEEWKWTCLVIYFNAVTKYPMELSSVESYRQHSAKEL